MLTDHIPVYIVEMNGENDVKSNTTHIYNVTKVLNKSHICN